MISHRPIHLLYPLGALCLGIYIQKILDLSLLLLAALTICAFTVFIIALTTTKIIIALSCIQFFFFLGGFLLSFQITTYKNKQEKLPNKKATFIAYVKNKTEHPNNIYKESLRLSPIDFSGNILCYQKKSTNITPGNTIKLKNVLLQKPQTNITLSGNPTYTQYLIKENIHATFFFKKSNPQIITKTSGILSRIRKWLFQKRASLFTSLKNKLSPKIFPYFTSIFLGNKQNSLKNNTKHFFYYWGTAHHLARSGLHIALFILAWIVILSFIPTPLLFKNLLLIIFCITYMTLSWSSISFMRAFSVFILYAIGQACNKQVHFLHLLILVAFAVLLFNPMQLFFLDFQLSFGLTIALAVAFEKQKSQSIAYKKGSPLICRK